MKPLPVEDVMVQLLILVVIARALEKIVVLHAVVVDKKDALHAMEKVKEIVGVVTGAAKKQKEELIMSKYGSTVQIVAGEGVILVIVVRMDM